MGTLDSNTTLAYVDLTGNLVDDRLMHELDSINASRNISGIASLNRTASSQRKDGSRSQSFASSQGSTSTIPKSPISDGVSLHSSTSGKRSRSSTTSNSSRRGSKPPMHEVPEESDVDIAKRSAIMKIMKDTSVPWAVSVIIDRYFM